jgi:hypothetical protein
VFNRDKKVVGDNCRFRAPLQLEEVSTIEYHPKKPTFLRKILFYQMSHIFYIAEDTKIITSIYYSVCIGECLRFNKYFISNPPPIKIFEQIWLEIDLIC